MSWYQTFTDWLLPPRYRRRAYLKAYKAQLDRGQRDAVAMLAQTRETCTQLITKAEDSAATLREAAVQVGLNKGQIQAQQGNEKARKKAEREGAEIGKLTAYAEAARQLGLTVPTCVADVPPLIPANIDLDRLYPNVYLVENKSKWIVRVQVTGDLHYKEFAFIYNNQATKAAALIHAIRHRDTLAPAPSIYNTVYEECLAQAVNEAQPADPVARMHIRTCELFHQRVQLAGTQIDRVAWVGEDPQDSFSTAATATGILVNSWPVLFAYHPRKRIIQAFANVGLNEQRTVRDLLLLSGDELAGAGGFGPVTLRKLRQGLADLGLALWGDPIPLAPAAPRTTGEREFRAINLD